MQQYDQRRLRLFAVVLFLGIMAANLGRYLIFYGLYLWESRLCRGYFWIFSMLSIR